MLYVIGANVPMYVMDAYERLPCRQRVCLGSSQPDQQCPYQPRTVCDSYHIHFVHGNVRFLHGSVYHRVDVGQVMSGGYLRHYSTVLLMYIYLRRNDVGKHAAAFRHHGCCRFVAAGLYRECHCFSVFHSSFLPSSSFFSHWFSPLRCLQFSQDIYVLMLNTSKSCLLENFLHG